MTIAETEALAKTSYEYVLCLRQERGYFDGTDYLVIDVGRHSSDKPDDIHGTPEIESIDYEGSPKHLEGCTLAALACKAFKYKPESTDLIWMTWSYWDVHRIQRRNLDAMSKTLRKIEKAISKERAITPTEQMMAVANALRIKTVAHRLRPEIQNRAGCAWRLMSLAEGRLLLHAETDRFLREAKPSWNR